MDRGITKGANLIAPFCYLPENLLSNIIDNIITAVTIKIPNIPFAIMGRVDIIAFIFIILPPLTQ